MFDRKANYNLAAVALNNYYFAGSRCRNQPEEERFDYFECHRNKFGQQVYRPDIRCYAGFDS